MASKRAKEPTPFVELGATGLRAFGGYVREEWFRDLQGRRGIIVFKEMRDNDPIIGAMFFAIELLLRAVKFTAEPLDENDPADQSAADFVESCLGDMEQTWPEMLSQFLTFLQFGWGVSEIVFKMRQGRSADPMMNSKYSDGLMGWRKFAPRAQETLLRWDFDEAGDPVALIQLLPTGGPLLTVPLARCLHFKTRLLKNNPEGMSIMRNAYTSYYFKKKIQMIEGVGIERDLAGLPIVWVPAGLLAPDASSAEKAQLNQLKKVARDTYRNEQEGLVFPLSYDAAGNKLFDFTLLATGGRRQFTTNEVIDRYDQRIASTVLADFITLGSGSSAASGRGSTGQAKNKTGMFETAVVGFLDLITGEVNKSAIPDLLAMNGMPGRALLHHGDIARRDLDQLGNYVQALATAGILTPDLQLETHLREEGGLPIGSLSEGNDIAGGSDSGGGEAGNVDDNPARTDKPGHGQGQSGAAKRRVAKRKKLI